LQAADGFELEIAGPPKGSRKLWALVHTGQDLTFQDVDKVKFYLLL
jgi:hypothetical protein